jgi:flagellar protein FliT
MTGLRQSAENAAGPSKTGHGPHRDLSKKILKKSFENPKVLRNATVKGRQPAIRPDFQLSLVRTMTSNEVLAMYENIAALTGRMAAAARDGDWNGFAQLETQCALQASAARTGTPALEGDQRKRKIDLLKQIMGSTCSSRSWPTTAPCATSPNPGWASSTAR